MSINIGNVKHHKVGEITLEISNDDEFIARVKEINREIPGTKAEKMKLWKIRTVGEEKPTARIKHLIAMSNGEQSTEVEDATSEESTDTQQNTSSSPVRNSDPHGALKPRTDIPEGMTKAPVPEDQKPKRRIVRRDDH